MQLQRQSKRKVGATCLSETVKVTCIAGSRRSPQLATASNLRQLNLRLNRIGCASHRAAMCQLVYGRSENYDRQS